MTGLRLLLWLLPASFRREYGDELLAAAHDQWCDVPRPVGRFRRSRFWLRQGFAIVKISVSLRARRGILGGADQRNRRTNRQLLSEEAPLKGLLGDVRHSARSLLKRPTFTLVAVLTLGLGVGATTAMFSAVNSVLLRQLVYEDPESIVVLKQINSRDGSLKEGVSAANMYDLAGAAQSFSAASVAEAHGLRLIEDGKALSLRSWLVSEGFFEAMGAPTQLGRTFLPEEFETGGDQVVLLGHLAWQTRFGGDPDIIGRTLVLDGSAHTVVGVLAPDFKAPSAADVWGPRPAQAWDKDQRARASLPAVARLSPGTTLAQAQAELDLLATDLAENHPAANKDLGLRMIPLRQHLFGDVESPLILMMGAVGLVLLIAAANVAGLQLARGAEKSREYALRGALGASSRRILGLVAVESLLLATAGGLLGIGFAYLGVEFIGFLGPNHLPRLDELRIDGAVLSFALFAATGSALIAGIGPALRASRMNLNAALTEGSRGGGQGRRSIGLRDRLVVAEIALAVVLTIGAGLLVRSFDQLLDNELGFDPERRLAVQVWAYDDDHQSKLEFFGQCKEALLAVPGVLAVGLTTDLPLADDQSVLSRGNTVQFKVDDRPVNAGHEPFAHLAAIDGTYASTMGIHLSAGRGFGPQDHLHSSPVVMVNEAFVRRHFLGQEPVGKRITLGWRSERSTEIVGVLADVRRQGFESEPQSEVYVPLAQEPSNGLTFVVETATAPAAMAQPIQEAMWATDPSQATWATRPMSDLMWDWVRERRFNMALLAGFAGLALFLAAIGVYGLMSFSVEQRAQELGIRRALGGQKRDILYMVLKRGLLLAMTGASLGVVGSLALTRLLEGMLFAIDPLDPLTFALVSGLVVVVAVLAAFLPARRATRVDPMIVLRTE